MKLFYTPASPFVRKVMVTAIELGLDSRIEIIPTVWPLEWGYKTTDYDPAFVAANPVAKIPTLVTDDGLPLPGSHLICEYLDSLHGGASLIPREAPARWRVLRIAALVDGLLDGAVARRAETLRRPPELSADFIDKQTTRIARCFDALEDLVDELGPSLRLGHIYAGVACGFMDFRFPEDAWRTGRPRLAAWYATFAERPSMQRTLPRNTPEHASELGQ